jgi:hypothetical protein
MTINEEFSIFWPRYPKRVARGAAWKAFKKARLRASFEDIMRGLDRFRQHMSDDAQFRPHAGTWLTQDRWTDDYDDPPVERPHVEGRKDCTHEPKCPSNEWHAVMLDKDAARKQGAA